MTQQAFWDYGARMLELARRKGVRQDSKDRWFDVPMWVYEEARKSAGYTEPGKDGERVVLLGLPVRALAALDPDALRYVEKG